jgi:hypothetical protein
MAGKFLPKQTPLSCHLHVETATGTTTVCKRPRVALVAPRQKLYWVFVCIVSRAHPKFSHQLGRSSEVQVAVYIPHHRSWA